MVGRRAERRACSRRARHCRDRHPGGRRGTRTRRRTSRPEDGGRASAAQQPLLTAPSPTRGRVHIARTTSPSRPPPLSVFRGTRPYIGRATEFTLSHRETPPLSWVADALQLDAGQCEWDDQKRAWHICHDGRMSQVPREVATEAVREAHAGRWIDTDDNGRSLPLRVMPGAGTLSAVNRFSTRAHDRAKEVRRWFVPPVPG